jgi:hypothetical protein
LPDSQLSEKEKLHLKYLKPLLDKRKSQAGLFYMERITLPEWTVAKFLEKWNISLVSLEPAELPYYILIVAPPDRISWEFQQDLDGRYAVGRAWFDDPEECKLYVEGLLAYEGSTKPANSKEVLLVGARHDLDDSTIESAEKLVKPLYKAIKDDQLKVGFQASLLLGEEPGQEAKLANLFARLPKKGQTGILHAPAVLFTASHGAEAFDDPDYHGSLLLNDYPGEPALADETHVLHGGLFDDRDLRGMLTFCFACYSAGTGRVEDWIHPKLGKPKILVQKPFVARLPQKMLASGLLAFIGHVSKAWGYSYYDIGLERSGVGLFTNTFKPLLKGLPVGHALDWLNQTAQLYGSLVADQLATEKVKEDDKLLAAAVWGARQDARGYVVLGDPFAMLRVDKLH